MADVPIPRRVPAKTRISETSPVRHIDLPLVAAAIGLSVLGLLMIYSSTHRSAVEFGASPTLYLKKQIVFLILGIIGMVVAAVIDYGLAQAYAPGDQALMIAALEAAQTRTQYLGSALRLNNHYDLALAYLF